MIQIIQKKIEKLYRLDSYPEVYSYLMNSSEMSRVHEKPLNPQVLFKEEESGVSLGVFLGDRILCNIHSSPKVFSFQDFCIMVEEISHYIYLVWSKCNGKKINLLDLEIQAEIDKFLIASDVYGTDPSVFEKLFHHFSIRSNIQGVERQRYLEAHRLGKKLISHFRRKKISNLKKVNWLRFFYRQNSAHRIAMIEHGLH